MELANSFIPLTRTLSSTPNSCHPQHCHLQHHEAHIHHASGCPHQGLPHRCPGQARLLLRDGQRPRPGLPERMSPLPSLSVMDDDDNDDDNG